MGGEKVRELTSKATEGACARRVRTERYAAGVDPPGRERQRPASQSTVPRLSKENC